MTQIANNLKVSRQALYKPSVTNSTGYNKKDDPVIVPMIQEIIQKRPTYGYKRVTAMVNKTFAKSFNKKRIYRIMRKYGLLLPKSQTTRKHTGTGKVMTLRSNTRWCSDAFEIKCFNGEKVYVCFALDCKDREILAFHAQTDHLTEKSIQNLMIQAVEYRFNALKTPRQIQWLSDRGSIYRSKNVRKLATYLGLKCCYTAAYSPSSNGMAEAFVGSFKRDYVYVNDCFDAKSTIKMIHAWIEDYNNIAPHSGLNMLSPREHLKINN